VRATGATGPQVLDYGIVPQILPAFAGISVFRWDINIRESTVLGPVGASGIGLQQNFIARHEALEATERDPSCKAGHQELVRTVWIGGYDV
jgi:ABC-type phosphate/phosphonate transport system permease subunit